MTTRTKILGGVLFLAALLLVRNLKVIYSFPDEEFQGAIYRIIFFHVPAAWTAFLLCTCALVSSILFLVKRDFKYDAFAVAATEVSLAFGAVNLITGMIWARIIWGIWWTWDMRLTSMLVCWLLYAGYLMLRQAIEEPTQRARIAAALQVFIFADIPIVFFSIKWWRTQHPQPVVWGGGKMDPEFYKMMFMNWLPLLVVAAVLVAVRLRQENMQREVDALRREALAF
jgi:heme exporter protein C